MKRAALLLALLATVALAACGGGGTDSSSDTTDRAAVKPDNRSAFEKEHPGSAEYGSPPLEFEADPNGGLAYTTDEVTAKEGNVTIEFTNPQSTPHNVVIEASGGGKVETETISEGFSAVTVTLNRKEKFIFYCSVPGHRKAGMEGTVKVLP